MQNAVLCGLRRMGLLHRFDRRVVTQLFGRAGERDTNGPTPIRWESIKNPQYAHRRRRQLARGSESVDREPRAAWASTPGLRFSHADAAVHSGFAKPT